MASKIHVLPTDNNNKDVVADVPDEVFDIYTTSKMYQAMKPLFMTLRIFGLTYVRSFGPVNQCNEKVRCHNTGEEYTGEKHGKGKCSASQIYAWTVCVSMYLMGLRVVTVFSYGEFILGPDLFYKLTTFTWTCLLLANLTMFMLASHRYTGIPKFFIEFVDSPCSTCPSKVRKVAWITMGVSWMLMAFCAAVILYAVIWDPVLIYPLLAPFQLGDDGTLVIRILLVIFGPLMCALWMCPVSMDVIFCYTLYRAFTHWNLKFKSKVCGMTTETFIKERRHHQKICRLVAEADDFLSIHKAWSLVFNVAIILFILYTLLYASDEMRTTAFYVANLTWFTLIWVNLITTCISGILVNDAVSTWHQNYFFYSSYRITNTVI